MLTGAVRDLHLTFPGHFATDVRTSCGALWENIPYLTKLDDADPEVEIIDASYPLINESNQLPLHFIHGCRIFLCSILEVGISGGRDYGNA